MISSTDIEDMTDAQDEAPERIWLDIDTFNGAVGFAHQKPHAKAHWPAYIRTDLAEDERVARLVEAINDALGRRQVTHIHERLRAALAAMDTPKGGGDA